jgi:hypothetical protein
MPWSKFNNILSKDFILCRLALGIFFDGVRAIDAESCSVYTPVPDSKVQSSESRPFPVHVQHVITAGVHRYNKNGWNNGSVIVVATSC